MPELCVDVISMSHETVNLHKNDITLLHELYRKRIGELNETYMKSIGDLYQIYRGPIGNLYGTIDNLQRRI